MRIFFGLLFMTLMSFFWFFSMIFDPYQTWGYYEVRTSVANLSAEFAAISIAFLIASGFVLFPYFEKWRDGRAVALAVTFYFFGVTAIARLVWIEFYVLS